MMMRIKGRDFVDPTTESPARIDPEPKWLNVAVKLCLGFLVFFYTLVLAGLFSRLVWDGLKCGWWCGGKLFKSWD